MYGVPYELFKHLNPRKLEPFKIAFQRRQDIENQNAWISGIYFKDAIASCFDKNFKYPSKPIDLFEKSNVEDGSEKVEMLASAEMAMFAKALEKQGMPLTQK